ncbi:hypothetical protein J7I93_23480 [Bacillus sp. ISL-47]|uniref:hypothetical protein n=1 Tax=Bacillus sp. ISL-47 TaxID=2819130 RepID=UPI001BECD4B7|nr:hypothetical protein [Bacillus sp. ISL-47]MBT2691099.1 hypothetical protein [Bacillus sp. ISL-47]MBT2707534.1 hypothetical protein [Pseudomonas sp. ISL-84]
MLNNTTKKLDLDPEVLKQLGIPEELIEMAAEAGIPSINNHAAGGTGGRAINLTYVDNYSTLLLVYTFLLNFLDKESDDTGTKMLNQSLLSTLNAAIIEQQEYRKEFLKAVDLLRNQ